jgi:hypothetical protein
MADNPLVAWIKEQAKVARRKLLDEIFVFVDPAESPLTAKIREYGDEPNDTLRGIILTLAELEKRLPPAKDEAA